MPWRPTPDREPAHRRTRAFWQHAGIPVTEADSHPNQPFNLSAARNNAAHACTTDLIIVADADTIPDLGAIHTALTDLECHPHLVIWPYHTYRHIPADWTNQPDLMAAPIDRIYHNSVGGLLITTQETYWALGGMDEHFQGWGYEDNAFHAAATTLAAVTRLPGIVFSFNHPTDRDTSTENPNRHRHELYKFALGKPAIMRELIKR
jgi:hypothetical protein